jgi:hypothetical protein
MTVNRTEKPKETKPSFFDWSALTVISAVAAVELICGIEALTSSTGVKYGFPPAPYFFMGSVAVLATVGDIRLLVRGGISGVPRIARHLWRMCFALFIASGSIFLARQQLFPALLRKTGALIFLSVLPLFLMIFWLVRVRFTNLFKEASPIPRPQISAEPSLRARFKNPLKEQFYGR